MEVERWSVSPPKEEEDGYLNHEVLFMGTL